MHASSRACYDAVASFGAMALTLVWFPSTVTWTQSTQGNNVEVDAVRLEVRGYRKTWRLKSDPN
jgi:hypothetical protein